MNPAIATVLALILAIALSIVSRINVGLVAIAFAWLIGVYVAGLGADAIVRGFPSSLFITLTGVTLLFAVAETNGTLERLAHRAVALAKGDARVLPLLFFVIACVVATIGPGSIASVALVVPLAMLIGERAGVPHLITALMVALGANAGNLSPISAVGIIANSKMAEAGLGGHEAKVWLANLLSHVLVAGAVYFLLGGHRLAGRANASPTLDQDLRLTLHQRVTAAVIATWIVGVVFFKLNLGLSAFAAVALLVGARAAQDAQAIKRMPWGAIVMVCGVSVLIGLLEATGGMDLFAGLLSLIATPATVNGVMAFITGAISTYSSTSGVVLPAFLPTVPDLVTKVGGGDPLAVSLSINVGASLVDVSPLSTLGALCIAAVPDGPSAAVLFRRLFIFGLSMTVVGAVLCQLFAGPFARM
ncbi:MAG: SLC13 family permease [Longimicrobiales bacterium]